MCRMVLADQHPDFLGAVKRKHIEMVVTVVSLDM